VCPNTEDTAIYCGTHVRESRIWHRYLLTWDMEQR